MRIVVSFVVSVACGLALSAGLVAPALALDADAPPPAANAPVPLFKDPRAALRQGMDAYRRGDKADSLPALRYAADGGEAMAQWKLGRMYAAGDGVPHNDFEAYKYFARIVRDYKEEQADPRDRAVVASAFVAVGVYSLNGIANSNVKPAPMRAFDLFHFAATNFGDPDAQYNLARMYLDGAGVQKSARQAAPWLRYAAEKNHVEAQALLGNLLFNGFDGVSRQRARGLMYLTLAREAATDPQKHAWIISLYREAMTQASDIDKEAAHIELKQHLRRRARAASADD